MPELPEVETVRRGLAPVMEGRRILKTTVNRPDLRWPFPQDMAARLTGRQITRLDRRSKYLLLALDQDETLLVHLGMSGRMLISGVTLGEFHHPQAVPEKHDHVVFDLEGGARVTFNDARRFGAMDLFRSDAADSYWLLAGLGPEPLSNGFDEAYLAARFAGKKMPVKTALLDQKIIAGLGNIYVCEALHRSGISPLRLAGDIRPAELGRLVPAIRQVLAEAIEAGGSSLRDHRQASGELGYFQHAFRVYGREGQPCPTPGCAGTVERVVQAGRSSFWCPQCQH